MHKHSKIIGCFFLVLVVSNFSACVFFSTDPIPGPDKQSVGTWVGAATGAGAGAVTGAQLSAGTGPGAWVGAAFGAVYGMFSGLGVDLLEENQITRELELEEQQRRAWAQEIFAEHFQRRLELHPSRDIFPADLFFEGDSSQLTPASSYLARELGTLTVARLPWSRIAIAAYTKTSDTESSYAQYLSKKRAEQIALEFVKAGVEPRRIVAQGIPVKEAILIDPDDNPSRYNQAIEIIPLDR